MVVVALLLPMLLKSGRKLHVALVVVAMMVVVGQIQAGLAGWRGYPRRHPERGRGVFAGGPQGRRAPAFLDSVVDGEL